MVKDRPAAEFTGVMMNSIGSMYCFETMADHDLCI